jgi:hypothetical protein
MTKVLRINDSGFVWEVPAEAIAKNRASYYAENDKDTTYDEEFNFTMGDNYELRDWFFNNMDWDDVESVAKLVASPTPRAKPRLNHADLECKIVTHSPQETAND